MALGYIQNDSKRFHMYVANRVQTIRDKSNPTDWYYIETEQNPADLASRGVPATQLVNNDFWFKGPEFLRQNRPIPARQIPGLEIDDPAIRKNMVLSTDAREKNEFLEQMEGVTQQISSWNKLITVVAVML